MSLHGPCVQAPLDASPTLTLRESQLISFPQVRTRSGDQRALTRFRPHTPRRTRFSSRPLLVITLFAQLRTYHTQCIYIRAPYRIKLKDPLPLFCDSAANTLAGLQMINHWCDVSLIKVSVALCIITGLRLSALFQPKTTQTVWLHYANPFPDSNPDRSCIDL